MAIDENYVDRLKGLFGASNTNLQNIDSGALASLFNRKREPLDPALLALIASTTMTEQASKPGATAVGAGASGILKATELQLASDVADRKADASSRSDLLKFLGQVAKPKTTTRKVLGKGTALNYMTEEEAKKFLTDRGISENIPGYKDFIYKVSTTDAEQLGTPAIFAGKPIEFNIETEGSEIRSVITNQIQGSLPDSQYSTKQKKIDLLNKKDESITQMTTLFPRLRQAKDILLNPETTTGFGQTEPFLTLKQGLKTVFGFTDADLADQQLLQSLSFQLAPLMRPKGSGSTSDMEFKAYQKGILSLGNEKEANYLNLYTLEKMTENGIKLNKLEKQLLAHPKNYSYKYIDDKIAEQDIGIFDKIYKDADGDNRLFDNDGDAKFDDDDEKKNIIKNYYVDLPKGAVFINDDGRGNKLFDGLGTYIIKGISLPTNFGQGN